MQFLSIAERQKRLLEIEEKLLSDDWEQNAAAIHNILEEKRKQRMERVQEFQQKAATIQAHNIYKQDSLATAKSILAYPYKLSGGKVYKVREIPETFGRTRVRILAFCKEQKQKFYTLGIRVVLQALESENNGANGKYFVVWPTKRMHMLLEQTIDSFYSVPFSRKHLYWIGVENTFLDFSICKESTASIRGKQIVWNHLEVHHMPNGKTLEEIGKMLAQLEEEIPAGVDLAEAANPIWLQKIDSPQPKNTLRTKDMAEGDYQCSKYAIQIYRQKPRTVLFLQSLDATATPTNPFGASTKPIPVVGSFLEDEVAKIDLETTPRPILCRIGKTKTTKTKKKDKIFQISLHKPDAPA